MPWIILSHPLLEITLVDYLEKCFYSWTLFVPLAGEQKLGQILIKENLNNYQPIIIQIYYLNILKLVDPIKLLNFFAYWFSFFQIQICFLIFSFTNCYPTLIYLNCCLHFAHIWSVLAPKHCFHSAINARKDTSYNFSCHVISACSEPMNRRNSTVWCKDWTSDHQVNCTHLTDSLLCMLPKRNL